MKASRRAVIAGLGASALAAPQVARVDRASVLKFIPHADLGALDPIRAVRAQNAGWPATVRDPVSGFVFMPPA